MIDLCFVGNSSIDLIKNENGNRKTFGGSAIYSSLSCRSVSNKSIGIISSVNSDFKKILDSKQIYLFGKVVDEINTFEIDELMTFKFHPMDGDISDSFLQGFGKETFSEEELIRMKFYRIFTLLKTAISCKANNYGYFDWLYNNMNSLIDDLKDKKVYKKEK